MQRPAKPCTSVRFRVAPPEFASGHQTVQARVGSVERPCGDWIWVCHSRGRVLARGRPPRQLRLQFGEGPPDEQVLSGPDRTHRVVRSRGWAFPPRANLSWTGRRWTSKVLVPATARGKGHPEFFEAFFDRSAAGWRVDFRQPRHDAQAADSALRRTKHGRTDTGGPGATGDHNHPGVALTWPSTRSGQKKVSCLKRGKVCWLA